MSAEWFQEQLFPYEDGDAEDGCHPSEVAALKDYLEHRTSAEQAADAITRYTESLETPVQHQPVLWGFGRTWANDQKPGWFKWRKQVSDNDPSRSELRAKFIRKAEIEARLVSENIGGIDLDWGYECIVEALERSDAVLDFEIPAMQKWIRLMGIRLSAGGVHGRQSSALEIGHHFGNDCGRTLTLDRWWFWERRLQEILHHSQGYLDVKEITHDGELVMRRAASAALAEMKACATSFYKEDGLIKLRNGSLEVFEVG